MKSYGARIRCATCGAEPWPDDPGIRETFDLRRFGPDGRVAESPKKGEWRCSEHFPKPNERRAPVASVRPAEALAELEETLAVENARLDGAVFDTDGAFDDIVEALDAHHQKIERSLAKFRKAATPC
jgi:hypothetical protein